jgi:hypothetical protein
MCNTLIAGNTPGGNDTFAHPKLGLLADNGGATMTMALLPESPAIDAGEANGAPATDQRGILRPQGLGIDIGAFEFQFLTARIIDSRMLSPTSFWLQACGRPVQAYTLQVSTNLLAWSDIKTNISGANGVCEFVDTHPGDCGVRFYRLKSLSQ